MQHQQQPMTTTKATLNSTTIPTTMMMQQIYHLTTTSPLDCRNTRHCLPRATCPTHRRIIHTILHQCLLRHIHIIITIHTRHRQVRRDTTPLRLWDIIHLLLTILVML